MVYRTAEVWAAAAGDELVARRRRSGRLRPGGSIADMDEGRGREELWVATAGRVPYREAVALQERLRDRRQAGDIPDALLLLEHDPVYTKGRRTTAGDLPLGDAWYRGRGIDVADTDRGGRVTYHGPGQLVGYPIVRVTDVVEYVRAVERALIAALADEGVGAEVRRGLTGVWVGERKIGSIGVHVSRGVTTHGFAVNVDNDLEPFSWVVPCGIAGVRMTSLGEETGRAGGMRCFRRRVAWRLAEALGLRQRLVSIARLRGEPALAPIR
ncbi:MAG: lipoyl(octanoyl) transferase LipB, partial [Actinomycetota bacterium]|nr:lipoyl(octanoyl) transferase LipB [Actinomycetota bacterium]